MLESSCTPTAGQSEYYLTSRTSISNEGKSYAMTKSTIKNMSAKSGIDYNSRSVAFISNDAKVQESVLTTDPLLVAPVTSSPPQLEQTPSYSSSRTSEMKDSSNYAVTNTSWKKKAIRSGVERTENAVDNSIPMVDNLATPPSDPPLIEALSPPTDTVAYYLSSRTSKLKPGKSYAPTKTRIKNVSTNSGLGYQIGSMMIPSATRTIRPATDPSSTLLPVSSLLPPPPPQRDAPLSSTYYLVSRTSQLKPGISFAPTKTTVKRQSARPGFNLTSMVTAAAVVVVVNSTTTVLNPYLEPLGYYLSSRTSKLKEGRSYAPTQPVVKNISSKSGLGFDIRSVIAALAPLSDSRINNPYLEPPAPPPLSNYHLTSRTSKLKHGMTFAPTKPMVKYTSGKSGIGYHIRSAITNVRTVNVTAPGNVTTTTTTTTDALVRLEYYLSSRTSLLKPGRNYAPTSRYVHQSPSGTSGNGGSSGSSNGGGTSSSTTIPTKSSSSSSLNIFRVMKERAATTLHDLRDSLFRRRRRRPVMKWTEKG